MDKFGEYVNLSSFHTVQTGGKEEKIRWYIFFKNCEQLFDANKAAFQTARKKAWRRSEVMLSEHGADRGCHAMWARPGKNYRIRIMM